MSRQPGTLPRMLRRAIFSPFRSAGSSCGRAHQPLTRVRPAAPFQPLRAQDGEWRAPESSTVYSKGSSTRSEPQRSERRSAERSHTPPHTRPEVSRPVQCTGRAPAPCQCHHSRRCCAPARVSNLPSARGSRDSRSVGVLLQAELQASPPLSPIAVMFPSPKFPQQAATGRTG